MNPGLDASLFELLVRNLSWMTGNLFLAWAPMLFVWHLHAEPRMQRIAANVLMVAVPVLLFARLSVTGATVDAPLRTIGVVAAVGALAALWSVRARAGGRVARAVGYVGVLAFAPNAPYIMTDLFHHAQDIRLAGGRFAGNVLISLQYGWFLVLGTAAWVALVDAMRDWLQRHRPATDRRLVLVVASAVMAFGIYLGRIERFHSWHPLREPGRFLDEVGLALTSPGPVAFVLVWWIAVAVAGWVGVRLLDTGRRSGTSIRSMVARSSWVLSGALLMASPLVPFGYDVVGPAVPEQSVRVVVASVVLGGVVVLLALPRRRRALTVLAPIAAVLLMLAAMAQWHAQFRGLCEYGPAVNFHGDACDP